MESKMKTCEECGKEFDIFIYGGICPSCSHDHQLDPADLWEDEDDDPAIEESSEEESSESEESGDSEVVIAPLEGSYVANDFSPLSQEEIEALGYDCFYEYRVGCNCARCKKVTKYRAAKAAELKEDPFDIFGGDITNEKTNSILRKVRNR